MIRSPLLLLALLALALAPTPAAAQQFVPTKEPVYQGVRATADLPTSQHKRNTGGSDGAGLCVYTSFWHQAIWQSVREVFGFRAWMERRPGGSYPEKFDRTLAAYCKERKIPLPGYVQHTGGDAEFLKLALKTGRMCAVTYCGVDDFYGAEVIAHMVNLVHLDESRACVVDNNRPGVFVWMSAADFLARWRGVQRDGRPYTVRVGPARWMPVGGGWAIVLLESPPTPYPATPTSSEAAVCPCGDDCKCEPGSCPGACEPEIQFGQLFRRGAPQQQCPGGVCPLPTASAGPFAVQDLPPGRVAPWYAPPGPDYHWKNIPGIGDQWIQDNGGPWLWGVKPDGTWGWLPRPAAEAKPEKKIDEPQAGGGDRSPLAVGADPFPGGVDPTKLVNNEAYSISGRKCDKITALAALAAAGGLSDDSARWHLAAVGDEAFCSRVRADVARLDPALRDKLHVQCYGAADWQVKQFDLLPGLTLRRPAVDRVGPTAGVVTPAGYGAAALDELLAPVSGKVPAPQPKPKDPDGPKVDPVPVDPPAPPVPAPDNRGVIAILAALVAVFLAVFRR